MLTRPLEQAALPSPLPEVWGTPLALLFPDWPGVAAEEARLPDAPPPSPPAEALQIANAVMRRQVEFATARLCARRAAARLGVPPFILRNGEDRAPLWPAGLVGSLTHTGAAPDGYCAAAVARIGDICSLGIDAEIAHPLPLRLWRFVLTPGEQIQLRGGPPDGQGLHAKIMFSAKECFYKAQYPLTRLRLGFHDVEITLDVARRTFAARYCGPSPAPPCLSFPSHSGRFDVAAGLVKTALVIPS